MRVISQDGALDFNYDNISLLQHGEDISVIDQNNEAGIIAQYSSEEKAKAALEKLHTAYMKVIAQREKDGVTRYYEYPKVWQFPNDDAIGG